MIRNQEEKKKVKRRHVELSDDDVHIIESDVEPPKKQMEIVEKVLSEQPEVSTVYLLRNLLTQF